MIQCGNRTMDQYEVSQYNTDLKIRMHYECHNATDFNMNYSVLEIENELHS